MSFVVTPHFKVGRPLAWILRVDIQARAHPFEELFGIAVEILFAAATSER